MYRAGLDGRGFERSEKPVPLPEGTRGAHHAEHADGPGFVYPRSRGRVVIIPSGPFQTTRARGNVWYRLTKDPHLTNREGRVRLLTNRRQDRKKCCYPSFAIGRPRRYEEQMKEIAISPLWAIIIPTLIAIWSFYKTKEAERESEWRKEKLKLYLNFVEALSGITDSEISDQGEIRFAKACNDLHALASAHVLKALHRYQDQIRISNPKPSSDSKQIALDDLLFQMRRDLQIKPSDKRTEFQALLWTSGKKSENP